MKGAGPNGRAATVRERWSGKPLADARGSDRGRCPVTDPLSPHPSLCVKNPPRGSIVPADINPGTARRRPERGQATGTDERGVSESRFNYLEGKRFCVVFVQVLDPTTGKVRLHCFRGRASIERGRLTVVDRHGTVFAVPSSAWGNIMTNDGTKLLQDAEYFVLVKADEEIDFVSMN